MHDWCSSYNVNIVLTRYENEKNKACKNYFVEDSLFYSDFLTYRYFLFLKTSWVSIPDNENYVLNHIHTQSD